MLRIPGTGTTPSGSRSYLKSGPSSSSIISLLLGALLIFRCIIFAGGSEEYAIKGIGDDTFYYQKLACNFLDGNGWSFDGEAKTTGFHLLFAYFLVFLNRLFGCEAWRASFLASGLIASVSIALTCFIALSLSRKYFGKYAEYASGIAFFSPLVILQVTSLMESWMSILLSSLAFLLTLSGSLSCTTLKSCNSQATANPNVNYKQIFACILVGTLATLARTDGILYLGALFFGVLLTGLLLFRRSALSKARDSLMSSSMLLIGGLAGLILVAIHNIILTGSASQSSASTKLYWSSVSGHTPIPIIDLISKLSLYSFSGLANFNISKASLALVMVFMAIALIYRCFYSERDNPIGIDGIIVASCSMLLILTYIIFYSFNSQAIQPWYISQILFPVSLLMGSLWSFLFSEKSSGLVVAALSVSIMQSARLIEYAPWPHQEGMLKAGRYLSENYKGKRIASWNAGIIGYFSGRNITNIDGLVNNEILPEIRNNSLSKYIKNKHIDYLVDYEAMISSPGLRLRGGYSDGRLAGCIEKKESVDFGSSQWASSSLYLYKVKPDCL